MGRSTALLALLLAVLSFPADARLVTDSTGRSVEISERIARFFAAGPPASVLLHVLAPEKMIGWDRAPRESEKHFLRPALRDLPALGRLTGRGDTLSLERLVAVRPAGRAGHPLRARGRRDSASRS